MEIQSRSVIKMPRPVIVAPIFLAFAECKKAGLFDKNATLSAYNFLEQSTACLKGVGPGGAAELGGRGIKSLRDLVELQDELLVGLQPGVAKAAYAAKLKLTAALEKNGIAIVRRFEGGVPSVTLAIVTDPVTGISYSQ